jgi:hypothetical protein
MSADGNNYGLNGNYDYNEFEIDSFDALQAFNGTYTISNWPKIFFGKPLENVAAVKILEATIPFTYYVINSTNNTFTLLESAGLGGGTVTIPVGNYTSSEFPAILKTALEVVGDLTYTVTYDNPSMKLTITGVPAVVAGNRDFSFVFSSTSTLAQILGCRRGTSIQSTISTTAPILSPPDIAQLNGPPYLYLNSRSLGSMVHLYLNSDGIINATGTGADGPQVCLIPVNTTRGNTITYKDPDPQKWFYTGSQNFTGFLDFYLTLGVSPENIPLDLNGGRFVVKLGILQSKAQGNDNMTSTRGNHRVVSRTWQAGGNRMEF